MQLGNNFFYQNNANDRQKLLHFVFHSPVPTQIMVWLLVLTPLPAFFLWSGIVLPSLMAAFVSEGSKFLLFDTAICRSSVWFPPGTESLGHLAESCSLGDTGKYAIAAAAIYFLSLVAVFLKTPQKRPLEPNYGFDFENGDPMETSDDFNDTGSERDHWGSVSQQKSDVAAAVESDYSITTRGYDSDVPAVEFAMSGSAHDEDELMIHGRRSLDSHMHRKLKESHSEDSEEEEDDRYNPKRPSSAATLPNVVPNPPLVSESRLLTAQKLAMNAIPSSSRQDLIDKFVSEFDAFFEQDM